MPTTANNHATVTARLRAAGCVFAEEEAQLLIEAAHSEIELDRMIEQRALGIPLEQIVGWAAFCGLRIAVEPGVFVPRRRTEYLVQEAVRVARPGAVVVDLCCGSGAVGAALAAFLGGTGTPGGTGTLGGIELHAADVEPAAVRCARRNIEPFGGHVHEGDLYAALPDTLRERVDVLVANAPYVPTDSIGMMPPEARLHEPFVALDGGADGLDVQRRVVAGASSWLAPGGHLLIETSRGQASTTAALFERAGLGAGVHRSEEFDATVVIGKARVIGKAP
ncbi:putative protein N(5)-glutamine methyltransferase [bacterium RCC_150]